MSEADTPIARLVPSPSGRPRRVASHTSATTTASAWRAKAAVATQRADTKNVPGPGAPVAISHAPCRVIAPTPSSASTSPTARTGPCTRTCPAASSAISAVDVAKTPSSREVSTAPLAGAPRPSARPPSAVNVSRKGSESAGVCSTASASESKSVSSAKSKSWASELPANSTRLTHAVERTPPPLRAGVRTRLAKVATSASRAKGLSQGSEV